MRYHRVSICLLLAAFMVLALATVSDAGWRNKRVRPSGDIITEEHEVDGVTEVELETIGTMHISFGDDEELRIEGDDNIVGLLEVRTRRGMLNISIPGGISIRDHVDLDYYLTVRELERVVTSSAGDFVIDDLDGDEFSILIESAGGVEMGDVHLDELEIEIDSAGDVEIEDLHARLLDVQLNSAGELVVEDGEVEELELSVNSAGSFDGRSLECTEAYVQANSWRFSIVNAMDRLVASTISLGSIYYVGKPEHLRRNSSSAGKVKRYGGLSSLFGF